MESAGIVTITVEANASPGCNVKLGYKTRDGTAKDGLRYNGASGKLMFGPFQRTAEMEVEIIDNDTYEEDQDFFIDLVSLESAGSGGIRPRGSNRLSNTFSLGNNLKSLVDNNATADPMGTCSSVAARGPDDKSNVSFSRSTATVVVVNDDL